MKCILVVLDGLNYQVAYHSMGYLQAQCSEGNGKLYLMTSELPSLSRPLYECILTGVNPVNSGIVNNGCNQLSKEKSIFHYAKSAGLVTAAAAYNWVSELYNQTPFNPVRDRHTCNIDFTIPYGHFYYEDQYPDNHLFEDAESLRKQYDPDFLLIHPMNVDLAGHKFGYSSHQYRNSARVVDLILSNYLGFWLQEDYQVIVTADHGMNDDKTHGGILDEERQVPFFVFGKAFSFNDNVTPKQIDICGTICQLLDIKHEKSVCYELLAKA